MALRRLAVISHSAVLEINQAVYRVLAAAHPELELRLIVPQRWRNSSPVASGYRQQGERESGPCR